MVKSRADRRGRLRKFISFGAAWNAIESILWYLGELAGPNCLMLEALRLDREAGPKLKPRIFFRC
jgi:hypothetical protein